MSTSLRAAGLAALVAALASSGCGGTDGTRTVTGRVVDVYGQPFQFIEVTVISEGRARPTVRADAAGYFTVGGVAATYQLVVRGVSSAVAYQGVTRSDPTVTVAASSLGSPAGRPSVASASAPISVDCGGPCPPVGARGATTAGLDAGSSAFTWETGAPQPTVQDDVSFIGPGPVTARLCALYAVSADGAPPAYWFGRSAPVSFMADDALTLPGMALAPVPTRTFHVDAQRPAGWSDFDNPFASLTATFGATSESGLQVFASIPFAGTDFLLPDLPDQATTVRVSHQDGTSGPWYRASEEQVPSGQDSVTVVMREAPVPVAPAAGAVAGFGDHFAWTGQGPLFRVAFGRDPWSPMLEVVTTSHSLELPKPPGLLSLGASSGSPLPWSVTATNEAATVDDLLAPKPPFGPRSRRSTWSSTASPRTVTWR